MKPCQDCKKYMKTENCRACAEKVKLIVEQVRNILSTPINDSRKVERLEKIFKGIAQ